MPPIHIGEIYKILRISEQSEALEENRNETMIEMNNQLTFNHHFLFVIANPSKQILRAHAPLLIL
jgi:hypothetical protein